MKKIIVLLLLLTSCATNVTIKQNGYPIPSESYYMINPNTNITCIFSWYALIERSTESYLPRYYNIFKEQLIPKNSKEVTLNLLVVNPGKKTYTLRKIVTKNYEKTKLINKKLIYKGKAKEKVYQLECPINDGRCSYSVQVLIECEQQVNNLGTLQYKVEGVE